VFCPCRSNLSLGELGLLDSGHASAQKLLHLTPGRLRVTSEDNFWSTLLDVENGAKVRCSDIPFPCALHAVHVFGSPDS
jgi:hypothetical protein